MSLAGYAMSRAFVAETAFAGYRIHFAGYRIHFAGCGIQYTHDDRFCQLLVILVPSWPKLLCSLRDVLQVPRDVSRCLVTLAKPLLYW